MGNLPASTGVKNGEDKNDLELTTKKSFDFTPLAYMATHRQRNGPLVSSLVIMKKLTSSTYAHAETPNFCNFYKAITPSTCEQAK